MKVRIWHPAFWVPAYFVICGAVLAADAVWDQNSEIVRFWADISSLVLTDIPTNSLSIGIPVLASILLAKWLGSLWPNRKVERATKDIDTIKRELEQMNQLISSSQWDPAMLNQLEQLNRRFASFSGASRRNERRTSRRRPETRRRKS